MERRRRRGEDEKIMKRKRVPRGRVKWGNLYVLRVLSYIVHILRSVIIFTISTAYTWRKVTYFRGSWHSSDDL